MKTYQITWSNGSKEAIKGLNYINALYTNNITPSMVEFIVKHILL